MSMMDDAKKLYEEHCKKDNVPNAKDWWLLNESERDYWYHQAEFHRDFWKEALADKCAVIIGG